MGKKEGEDYQGEKWPMNTRLEAKIEKIII